MPIIRHRQRAITSLAPVPGQGNWLNPNKRLGLLPPYFKFAADSFALTEAAIALDTSVEWQLVFRVVNDDYSLLTQTVLEAASSGIRHRILSNGLSEQRGNGGSATNIGALISPVDAEAYEYIIKADIAGNLTVSIRNLESEAMAEDVGVLPVGQALSNTVLHISNQVNLSNPFIGGIANIQWYEGSPLTLIYDYPMRTVGTVHPDSEGNGPDIILTEGSGVWIT